MDKAEVSIQSCRGEAAAVAHQQMHHELNGVEARSSLPSTLTHSSNPRRPNGSRPIGDDLRAGHGCWDRSSSSSSSSNSSSHSSLVVVAVIVIVAIVVENSYPWLGFMCRPKENGKHFPGLSLPRDFSRHSDSSKDGGLQEGR
ncbi:hypothetical protein V1477_010364 [Vespula maculifrons]|uniref:Uncharacterized protein n=1 Tax=Vespula maculifrons TaxID=7453 RepID=A0ABD2CAJ1_VESMC